MARQIGAQMIAIAAEGHHGRLYVSPSEEHELIASRAEPEVVPDTDLPEQALGFRVQPYGMRKHRDLFTARQLVALSTLSSLVTEAQRIVEKDSVAAGLLDDNVSINDGGFGARAYAEAVTTYLALALSRTADWGSSLGRWENKAQVPQQVFGRQTVSMVWDFAECNPLSNSTGSFIASVSNVCRSLLSLPTLPIKPGIVRQLDATASVNGIASPVICTDPPYYDNIGYADLSDYFYIWLRRCLSRVYPDLFSTVLVPKAQELVANPHRFLGDKSKARQFFEQGLGEAFKRMRDAQNPEYPLTIFYAFKQAEASEEVEEDGATSETIVSTGWETMLEALLQAGFAITGTWPMRTEMGSRMRGQESNALASSIVLICRTRSLSAPLTTRRDFVAALKRELPSALRQLQQGNIAPVDLAQAAIGPGMAVFSRYAKVLEADGSSMGVRAVLGLVNQALDEVLAEQESEYDPNTRWAIAWFEQFGMAEGLYGVAETLSKAKNSSVAALVEAGLVHAKGGKVRLLRRTELDNAWDPVAVSRLTIWEATQYLIRSLQNEGELAASALARRIGSLGEVARDLAYRLYSTCDRKGWVDEAVAYNSLVVAWPDIARLATKAEEVGSQTTYL
jgi:putative DNA methylase